MGNAARRSLERVAAAMGELAAAPIEFQSACDAAQDGVLLALPVLLAAGLLRYRPEMYSGTGNGTVTYTVAANTGPPRKGTITIAGQIFTVTQSGTAQKIGAFDNGYWLQDLNGNSVWDGVAVDRRFFFSLGVTGDWNGSGTKKVGVYRDGTWLLDFNGNGIWDGPGGG